MQQEVASAAAVSEVAERQRAALVRGRVLWDGVGLVLAADEGDRGLEVVEEHEAAYERLGRAAARTLHEQDWLEDRLAGMDEEDQMLLDPGPQGAYRGARRVGQAVPAEVLDEITEGLDELTAGLRHAQHAVARTAGPAPRSEEKHDGSE